MLLGSKKSLKINIFIYNTVAMRKHYKIIVKVKYKIFPNNKRGSIAINL